MDAIEAFRRQAERDRALVLQLRAATERLAQAEAARTEAIASAHRLALSIREIAAATGLSPSRVHQIVAAANEGARSAQAPPVAALVLEAAQLLPPDGGAGVARMRAGLIPQPLRLLPLPTTRPNTAVIFL